MVKKIFLLLSIFILLSSIIYGNMVFAGNPSDGGIGAIEEKMEGIKTAPTGNNLKTTKVINIVIGIIQVAGTGISLIVISLLGIKYLLASPSEKADVKKNIMPILIGCVLLFAGVQIAGIIENFTSATFK